MNTHRSIAASTSAASRVATHASAGSTIDDLEYILNTLMKRYHQQVPQLNQIVNNLLHQQLLQPTRDLKDDNTTETAATVIDCIENDHFALRSFSHPSFGINALEEIFLPLGYQQRDEYHFTEKKLRAHWYSPPAGTSFPRIFISELLIDQLSNQAQAVIGKYLNDISVQKNSTECKTESDLKYLLQLPWPVPTYSDYQLLQQESEYAAWVLCHGHVMNHFTIAVHDLSPPVNTVSGFNDWLEREMKILLNSAGGKMKISGDGGLIQSSTMAVPIIFNFADGHSLHIPGSFLEFAERVILPQYAADAAALQERGYKVPTVYRREGFEVANADKIFESTNT